MNASKTLGGIKLSEFHSQGFTIIPGYMDVGLIEKTKRDIEDILLLESTPGDLNFYYEVNGHSSKSIRLVENICGSHNKLLALSNTIAKEIELLFGEPAILFKDKIIFKYPGGGKYNAHRDGVFTWQNKNQELKNGWFAYAKEFINAALFLDEATVESGCIECVSGEHSSKLTSDLFKNCEDEVFSECDFQPITAVPGDMLLFDALTPHRSSVNFTNKPRRTLYFTYNRYADGDNRSAYYRDKVNSLSNFSTNILNSVADKTYRGKKI